MASGKGDDSQPPKAEEIEALERLAAGIIRAQKNRFIKELLRDQGIPIGRNKEDFERNLKSAIHSGRLRLQKVKDWRDRVEGWGNQHVYLYNLTEPVLSQLTRAKLRRKVVAAELERVWDADVTMQFPDEPELTSISFENNVLEVIWQEATPGWTPVPEKDIGPRQEGLDIFEYRAFRMVERRAITRFEARPELGLAGLFIANPIVGAEHRHAVREAKEVIGKLIDLPALEAAQAKMSVVSRNADQRNVPSNRNKNPALRTARSKMEQGGSYVEFAASTPGRPYWDKASEVVKVRQSIKPAQAAKFTGVEGVFWFPRSQVLSEDFRVQLYRKNDRVRLWASMDVDEVWTILRHLSTYQ